MQGQFLGELQPRVGDVVPVSHEDDLRGGREAAQLLQRECVGEDLTGCNRSVMALITGTEALSASWTQVW